MNNRSLQQTFDSYGKPLASSTFIRNEEEKPYDDRNGRNKYMEYDAFKEGIVKDRISFWEEHFRKLSEKHGFVDIPKKKIVKQKFKLVKSGIYFCSGPHPGFHFISSESVTSTGNSDFISSSNRITSIISPPSSESGIDSNEVQLDNKDALKFDEKAESYTESSKDLGYSDFISSSNRITSMSTPTSESGIESNEEKPVDEDAVKFDENAKSHTKTFRDIGVNTSYQKQKIINDYAETEESTESTNEVLDWDDLDAFKKEVDQMYADFMAEVGQEDTIEVRSTRDMLSRLQRTVTLYTRDIIILFALVRMATTILLIIS